MVGLEDNCHNVVEEGVVYIGVGSGHSILDPQHSGNVEEGEEGNDGEEGEVQLGETCYEIMKQGVQEGVEEHGNDEEDD